MRMLTLVRGEQERMLWCSSRLAREAWSQRASRRWMVLQLSLQLDLYPLPIW